MIWQKSCLVSVLLYRLDYFCGNYLEIWCHKTITIFNESKSSVLSAQIWHYLSSSTYWQWNVGWEPLKKSWICLGSLKTCHIHITRDGWQRCKRMPCLPLARFPIIGQLKMFVWLRSWSCEARFYTPLNASLITLNIHVCLVFAHKLSEMYTDVDTSTIDKSESTITHIQEGGNSPICPIRALLVT